MQKIGLVSTISALAMLAACSDGAVTSGNGSVTVNTSVIGGDLQNGAENAGNFARNSANAIGNGMSRAGDVIENNAKAAWNEVKDATRELREGTDAPAQPAAPGGNSTGN